MNPQTIMNPDSLCCAAHRYTSRLAEYFTFKTRVSITVTLCNLIPPLRTLSETISPAALSLIDLLNRWMRSLGWLNGPLPWDGKVILWVDQHLTSRPITFPNNKVSCSSSEPFTVFVITIGRMPKSTTSFSSQNCWCHCLFGGDFHAPGVCKSV